MARAAHGVQPEGRGQTRTWRPNTIKYAFRRGWLAELEVPNLGVEFVRALNKSPEAKFLQRLHVHTNAYEYEEGTEGIPNRGRTCKPGPDLPKGVSHYEMSLNLLARCPHFESVTMLHLGNPGLDANDRRTSPTSATPTANSPTTTSSRCRTSRNCGCSPTTSIPTSCS